MTGFRASAGTEKDPWSWWLRTVVVSVVIVHVGIGTELVLGPARWEQSNSLEAVHDLTRIPWPLWGIGFYGGALLIAMPVTRKLGYLLAAGVAALFVGASIIWTVIPGKTTNPIVIGLSVLAVLLLVAGAKFVTQQEADAIVREHSRMLDEERDTDAE